MKPYTALDEEKERENDDPEEDIQTDAAQGSKDEDSGEKKVL